MGTMTAVETSGRFGRAEFEALPEDAGDGIRYELLDGAIIVTPSPGYAPPARRREPLLGC